VKFSITVEDRFDRLDPLSYYVLKKISKKGPHFARYKSAINKYGAINIFCDQREFLQIIRVVNDLLKRDSSGFVGNYITSANELPETKE